MESIFIQIASYRDPELIPTIDDLINNADSPKRLTICIAHQHSKEDKWDSLQKYANDPRFIIIDIPHHESMGACWARNQIQQHYDNQTYTLQLDSHHRFVKGWDTLCIKMLKDLQEKGYNKPLLTSYISSYNPEKDPEDRHPQPWGMSFDKFTPEGIVFFLPYHIENKHLLPIKARFYSAHFAFTLGQFCTEVPHDPMLYFHGEEISITVRAYTHGYDLFHPHKIIAWHEYTRNGRTKHWDDDTQWNEKNLVAHARTRTLLGVDGLICTPCNQKSFEGYNIGTARSIKDYEVYAGIRFKDRSITEACLQNIAPPGKEGAVYFPKFKHTLEFQYSSFTKNDYEFAALIFSNKQGKEIYRKDYTNFDNILKSNPSNPTITIDENMTRPDKWILWAYSKSSGWAERIEGII
mgnify:FL=1|tara:strand:- start:14843 stop:16066 length:1224 start_codon:yes stop_codon:yes gene_type:complete